MTDHSRSRKKPAHWLAPKCVMLVRALAMLQVKRKTIARITGVSDTGITHYITRIEKHRTREDVGQPGEGDLREAARLLAEHVIRERAHIFRVRLTP